MTWSPCFPQVLSPPIVKAPAAAPTTQVYMNPNSTALEIVEAAQAVSATYDNSNFSPKAPAGVYVGDDWFSAADAISKFSPTETTQES